MTSLKLFPNLTNITLNFSSDSAVYQAALNLDAGIPGLFLELANIINLKYTPDRGRAPQIHLPADLIDAWINKVRALLHPSQRTDDSTTPHGAITPAGAPNPQESLDVPAGLPEEQVAAILYVIDNVFLLEKPCVFLSPTQINTIRELRKSLAALVSSKQDPVQAAQAARAAEAEAAARAVEAAGVGVAGVGAAGPTPPLLQFGCSVATPVPAQAQSQAQAQVQGVGAEQSGEALNTQPRKS